MQLFPRPNAILFILDPSIKMPSRTEVTNRVNSFLNQFTNTRAQRTRPAQQALLNKINAMLGIPKPYHPNYGLGPYILVTTPNNNTKIAHLTPASRAKKSLKVSRPNLRNVKRVLKFNARNNKR